MNKTEAQAIARKQRETEVVYRAIQDGIRDRGSNGHNSYQPPAVPENQNLATNGQTFRAIVSWGLSTLVEEPGIRHDPELIRERTQMKELYDAAYVESKKIT